MPFFEESKTLRRIKERVATTPCGVILIAAVCLRFEGSGVSRGILWKEIELWPRTSLNAARSKS